jgi:hypothetical protein
MADEAADIIAEEKAREEFLKKQAGNGNRPSQGQGNGSSRRKEDGDEEMGHP